jgi:hypothetical protein
MAYWEKEKKPPQRMKPFTAREISVWRVLNYMKSYYEDHLRPKWVEAYKNYFMYKLERELEIESFQTNIKSPIVKMYVDAMWTGLYDNVINFRVMWRNKEDQKKAENVRGFLERGFSVSDSRKEFMSTIKEALICGPGYAKIGFINQEKEIKYRKDFKTVNQKIKEQYPYIKYCSLFNIFHDPTVESASDSPYFLERKILSSDHIKKYYNKIIPNISNVLEDAKINAYYFSNYDYNKIKHSLFRSMDTVSNIITNNNTDLNLFIKNYITVDYKNQFFEVIEHWTDTELIILINGRIYYDGPNPLPIGRKPYVDIQYNKVPGLPFGHGLGTSLEDIQKLTDTLINLQMDNTKFQIAPMYQKLKGSDIFSEDKGTLEYKPFKVVETNTPNGLQRLELGSPEFTGVNMIQFLLQLGEMSEWVNSYSMGYQNKVERSATGVSALVQAFKSRLLPLVESMNHALSLIGEMWISTALALMDNTVTLRVIGKDGAVLFNEISLEDLVWKFDIEFDAQALKSATREVRRNQLIQLLQMAATAWIEPNTQQYLIDMRKLWVEVFDAFEMPTDMVLQPEKIIKQQSTIQYIQAKEQNKMQAKMQQFQPQQPQWANFNAEVGQEQQMAWQEYGNEQVNPVPPGWVTQEIPQEIQQEPWFKEEGKILSQAFGY